MTVDWKHHFRHLWANNGALLGSALSTGLLGHREPLLLEALPGSWDEIHPVLPVSPKVTWFYGQTLLERFPVKISGHTYIKHLNDVSLPVPPGWSISGSNYYFNNQYSTASSFPLPISSNQVSRTVSARYLFGRTTRAYLKSAKGVVFSSLPRRAHQLTTHLQDTNGYLIGELNLNLAQIDYQESRKQTEYELVVISAGEIDAHIRVVKQTVNNETSDLPMILLPDGLGWAQVHFNFPLGSVTSADFQKEFLPHRIGLYHVLWIEWEDGIAYRRGLGRVLKEAWDSMATEEIDLVLG
jgi:hypothetical protein